MRLATRFGFAVLLVLCATSAFAGRKTAPVATPLGSGAAVTTVRVGTTNVTSTCTLGITDPAAYIIDYIYPPNDAYYTFIDPATCTVCNQGIVNAVTAHAYVNFRSVCAQPVSVGIYGATGDAACYTPDPNNVLCAPFTVYLAPSAPGNYNFSIAIPGGCCISGPAFLKIEFVALAAGCNTSTTIPRLITTADCSLPCTSWNIYPGGGPDDLCYDIGFPGYPVMQLDVDCCASTPTHHKSWGTLKSIYR